jgi:hypothetical protein
MVVLVLTSTPARIGGLEPRFDALARTISRFGDASRASTSRGSGAGLSEVG